MRRLQTTLLIAVLMPFGFASAEDEVPGVETFTLDNGLVVMLREDHAVPLVVAQLRVRAGSIYDPEEKEGVSALCSTLMMYGTTTRTEDQINDEIAMLGATLSAGSGRESLHLSGDVPTIEKGALDGFLTIMADVALRANFPEAGFGRAKNRRIGALKGLVDDRGGLASRAFSQWVFDNGHPYGRATFGTVQSNASLTRADVASFHQANMVPGQAALGLSGDFDASRVKTQLEALFGAKTWSKKGARSDPWKRVPPGSAAKGLQVLLIDTGDNTLNQAQIRLGFPLQGTYHDAGWHAFHLMTQVLGGDFTARLNARLRVKEGLTYNARWHNDYDDVAPGAGRLSTYTSPKDVVKALDMTRVELGKMQAEEPAKDEMDRVKQRIIRGFVFRFETAEKVLGEHMHLWQERLPLSHLSGYNDKLSALTASDLQAAAQKDLTTDNLHVVVVGNLALQKDLEAWASKNGGTLTVKGLTWLGLK